MITKNFNDEKDQELLLLDLTSRAPYGVMVEEFPYTDPVKLLYVDTFRMQYRTDADEHEHYIFECNAAGDTISRIRPYLRSMDTMTEDEFNELTDLCRSIDNSQERQWIEDFVVDVAHYDDWGESVYYTPNVHDYLTKYMFDYRGLIGEEIALKALEGMYNF